MVELIVNVAAEFVLLTINRVSGRSIPKNETTQKAGEILVYAIAFGIAAIWLFPPADAHRMNTATYVCIALGLAAILFALIGVHRLRRGMTMPPDHVDWGE